MLERPTNAAEGPDTTASQRAPLDITFFTPFFIVNLVLSNKFNVIH
jgi:hypothetical protein